MRLVYLNPGNSSVMEAQVLELLAYYSTLGFFDKIVLLQGYKNREEKEVLLKKLVNYKLRVIWFKTYPNYTFFHVIARKSLNQTLQKLLDRQDHFFIHIRGELYGAFVKHFLEKNNLPLRYLVDIRGVSVEEVREYRHAFKWLKNNKITSYLKAYENLKRVPHAPVTVVSEYAKEYFLQKYNFDTQYIYVHPNICGLRFKYNENKRNEIRQKYGIAQKENLVVCSSNGAARWQKDQQIIEKLMQKGCKVMNLSPYPVSIHGVINKKVLFAEMPDYLSAADMAVLWRDKSLVNETASPSKFSEFAMMGLYVIHNGTVGIACDYIKNTNSGCLVDCTQDLDDINFETINLGNRLSWIKKAYKHFSVDHIATSYLKIYKDL